MISSFDRLRDLVIAHYHLAPERLQPDAPLESLGIDSLGTVELLWQVEDAFKIKLTRDPVDLRTLGDVAHFIDELLQQDVVPATALDSA